MYAIGIHPADAASTTPVKAKRQLSLERPAVATSTTTATRPQGNAVLPTHIQTARLRYTVLSSLPAHARSEFRALRSAEIEAADAAEERCARANISNVPGDGVTPCLGLYRGGEPRSAIKFSFDLSLKSVGAPKDVLIGSCPAGSNMTSCNTVISEAKAEQERLADTLDNQRRYPVATVGIAVSF